MTRKDRTSNGTGLGLICPACGKNGCNIIVDSDTIQVPSDLYKKNPCYLLVGRIPCDECKGDFWVIGAIFASKKLLSREKNSPITEGYLNSELELPIETRMMFNCPAGDEVIYQGNVDRWEWTCIEYRINGEEPFQWHLIGPFHFLVHPV